MPVQGREIAGLIEKFAPTSLAEEWDNVGWQLGDPGAEVESVLLALDVNEQTAMEARDLGASLIVSHHPLFFSPLTGVRLDQPAGRLINLLLQSGQGVYSAHTNLDNAPGGVSCVLAKSLGLLDSEPVEPLRAAGLFKLCVFVPGTHLEPVRKALTAAGAGQSGNYSDCTFTVAGVGSFRPGPGTRPFIGEEGTLTEVEEVCLETILPASAKDRVIEAMLKAHPYEEVAYDLYALHNSMPGAGTGRIGDLPSLVGLAELAAMVKEALGLDLVRCGGEPRHLVRRVAVCGGSGASLWRRARSCGADVLITGDIKYHEGQDMLAYGFSFIDAGHAATERLILPELGCYLKRCLPGLDIRLSANNQEPYRYI